MDWLSKPFYIPDASNVDAIEGDTVVITSEGDCQEYNLPKSQIEGYSGAEVSLKITFRELDIKYKLKEDFQTFFAVFFLCSHTSR